MKFSSPAAHRAGAGGPGGGSRLIAAIGLGILLSAAGAAADAQTLPTAPDPAAGHAQHQETEAAAAHAHNIRMDNTGAVMNENATILPRDCEAISRDYQLTVYAGRAFAADIPGAVYGLSQHEYRAEPCSRITVTFVNEDAVRHQWMVHGLPRYLYPAGMFHLEAAGGHRRTGTFIVPSDDRTYLVHCDMPQHMEKGMKAQLKVGRGSGDLWSIPGSSGNFEHDAYLPPRIGLLVSTAAFIGLALTALLTWWRGPR